MFFIVRKIILKLTSLLPLFQLQMDFGSDNKQYHDKPRHEDPHVDINSHPVHCYRTVLHTFDIYIYNHIIFRNTLFFRLSFSVLESESDI